MRRIPGSIRIALLLGAALVAGCSKDQAGQNGTQATPVAQVQHKEKARSETLVVPAGTSVIASLQTRLTTETNQTGDRFTATTTEPVIVDGRTVVPAGARIQGVLRDVQASGRIKGRARMTLDYMDIVDSKGTTHSIAALPLSLQAASKTKGDVEKIAAGGVLGAIIGGIAGGGKGAAIGAGAGAGAGTILMLATQGDEVVLEAGQRLSIHMTSPMSIVLVAQR